MVMFTCNRCSKGLKKKDVLNHSFQCGGRNNINVACIDCLKDFRGDEYDRHTSCVSEEVRYGGKGVVAKETGKKQNQWLGIVRQVLSVSKSLDHPVRKFLKSVQHFENIPRQKKKFHNWANSVVHMKDAAFLDRVFEILQEEFAKTNEANKSKDTLKALTHDVSDAQKEEHSTTVQGDEQDELLKGEKGDGEAHVEENGVNGTSKKKKKKLSQVEEERDDEAHVEENGVIGINKNKKKKRSQVEEERDDEAHVEENEANGSSKKKKKKCSQVEEEPAESAEPVENNDGALENPGEGAKLSNKERKMKKKKAKFEAELQEIENIKKAEETEDRVAEEEVLKTKKNKKRKLVNETGKPNMDSVDSKGSKRKKVDEDQVSGNGDGELSTEAASPSKKEKFQWHQMIVDVLKNSKSDELSVKKVTKKVINEYVSIYGDIGIHEKLHAKMTKKLQTCPGVRVLKDKVKLLVTEE